jgi:uncharacterized membrane protein YfcA
MQMPYRRFVLAHEDSRPSQSVQGGGDLKQPVSRLWPWFLFLALFYFAWLALVVSGDHWAAMLEHWGIAVAMAVGSYVAGSTPMGGGTVGFPILVLLFDEPATLGRDFSFAIQSIGMVSATIFILCRRQSLEWPMLRAALAGSLLGTPLGILFIAPIVPGIAIKVLFAVVWASFGVLHFYRLREITAQHGIIPTDLRFDSITGLSVGFVCGLTVASITGVGIDMVLYAVLVLVCHADLKIAIPTSVIIMAFTSVVGMCVKLLLGDVQPGVYENWLVASPVVALGAPLGVFIVNRLGRESTLVVVSLLCVLQFLWTMYKEWDQLQVWGLAAAFLGVVLFNLVFQQLHRFGDRLERRQRDYPVRSGL